MYYCFTMSTPFQKKQAFVAGYTGMHPDSIVDVEMYENRLQVIVNYYDPELEEMHSDFFHDSERDTEGGSYYFDFPIDGWDKMGTENEYEYGVKLYLDTLAKMLCEDCGPVFEHEV